MMPLYYEALSEKRMLFLDELFRMVRIPSIAVKNTGMEEIVARLAEKLTHIGFDTRVLRVNDSYPYLYGEIGEGDVTLLIYNHYDVQPADDADRWVSPPFEPVVRDGKIYGRGIADNKANLMLRMQAIELLVKQFKKLPVKIKWLIEGEEEIGSLNLKDFSAKYSHLWKDADICLWETGGQSEKGVPRIVAGLKGICYLKLSCKMGEKELHSANASLFDSAVWRLVLALGTLRDTEGHLTIPELNAMARKPNAAEMAIIAKEEWDHAQILKLKGREKFLFNQTSKTDVLAHHYFSGTCNIVNLSCGQMHSQFNPVLPNKAAALLDFRLIPDQDATKVTDIIRRHLQKHSFDDINVEELRTLPVAKSDINNEVLQYTISLIEESFGNKANIQLTSGGSGPAYYVSSQFGIPLFTLGANYPGTNAHGQNENICCDDYFKALKATIDVILGLAKYKRSILM